MKPKINNTRLFKEVASVIGAYRAFIELGRIDKQRRNSGLKRLSFDGGISYMTFGRTPQGASFWREILIQVKKKECKE